MGAADPRARCATLPELADVNTDQQDTRAADDRS